MVGSSSESHRAPLGKSSGTPRKVIGQPSGKSSESRRQSSETSRNPPEMVGNLSEHPRTPTPDMSRKPLGPQSSKRNRGHLSCYYILVRVDLMSERNSNLNLVGLNFCPPHYACRPTRCLRSSQRESCRLRPLRESILWTAKRVVREF